MRSNYLYKLPQRKLCGDTGGKAATLNQLLQGGYQVPVTWVCCDHAFLDFQAGNPDVLQILQGDLENHLDPHQRYAVRSSANLEDGSESSFAGQFKTILQVKGIPDLLEAIQSVWESVSSPSLQAYQPDQSSTVPDLHMSVLIQEMVQPVVSGVAFSINPVTGMDEVVIEAVLGSGEKLVQEGVTPWRWVEKWGSWQERPQQTEIELDVIDHVLQLTKEIAAREGVPVDLEWVYDGRSIFLIQLRKVTVLDLPIYSNHISREVFPGLIKPLIWSVNIPLVNGAWVRLLTELIGPNDIHPEDLARIFYNRAYFDMGTIGRIMELLGFPKQTLELLMGLELDGMDKPTFKPSPKTFALLPRMAGFILGKIGFGRQVERQARKAWQYYRAARELDLASWADQEIIQHIQSHFQSVQETAYYNIVTPLLMQLFNLVFDRRVKKNGIDPRSVSFKADSGAVDPYDPYPALQSLSVLYLQLRAADRELLEMEGYQALDRIEDGQQFFSALERFTDDFGHLSNSGNDFSAVPWRENPDLILQMISHHEWADRAESGTQFSALVMPAFRKWLLVPAYRRARRYQSLRDQIGAAYTLGYGLFRNAFLELGQRLVSREVLHQTEDIMFLEWSEIEGTITHPELEYNLQPLILERKAALEKSRQIQPPATIFGDTPVPSREDSSDTLTGTATSRGSYTGPTRVVAGLEDMHLVQEGDVLVIPYSDVSWTPLFAKAGAVVAEAGGILSHSSIIAREYGIPAVVAVPDACQKLVNLQVTVDGNTGQVIVHP